MSQPVIQFQSVSKYYRRRQTRSFRDLFLRLMPRRGPIPPGAESFWALREVAFEVQPGESIGLIGHNGAGKSTALKLIGGVIAPSQGVVAVHGRVGALLEIGAGFHPELSGRDNIYLNAALIGMGRAEVQRKFDSIVAFSEVEEFIDTPVKHYSSGMFMRLAFAVNIHLEPEILLVDEVLAVGDYAFQRKCLDRIGQLKQQGVTICLVSHAHDTVREHCTRALWLDHGRLVADGTAESVIKQYLDQQLAADAARLQAEGQASAARWGSRQAAITRVRLVDAAGQERTSFETLEPFSIEIEYEARAPIPPPVVGLAIHRQDGLHITGPNSGFAGLELPALDSGAGRVTYTVPSLPLLEGTYLVSVAVHNREDTAMYDYHDRQYPFRVLNRGRAVRERYGLLTLQGQWAYTPAPAAEPEA